MDSTRGLKKAVYIAKEVADILGMSVHTVYEKLPSMRIGKLRRYSRATVLDWIAQINCSNLAWP